MVDKKTVPGRPPGRYGQSTMDSPAVHVVVSTDSPRSLLLLVDACPFHFHGRSQAVHGTVQRLSTDSPRMVLGRYSWTHGQSSGQSLSVLGRTLNLYFRFRLLSRDSVWTVLSWDYGQSTVLCWTVQGLCAIVHGLSKDRPGVHLTPGDGSAMTRDCGRGRGTKGRGTGRRTCCRRTKQHICCDCVCQVCVEGFL